MRDEEAQRPQTTPSSSSNSHSTSSTAASFSVKKDGSVFEGLFGRGKYKLWALAAITLLALWSMFTGTVTLKWSDVNLRGSSQHLDPSIHGDLDVLVVIFHYYSYVFPGRCIFTVSFSFFNVYLLP